ncbi:MAG TPA: hypothetical protein VII56_13505 [Rhizomicrobium sp.]
MTHKQVETLTLTPVNATHTADVDRLIRAQGGSSLTQCATSDVAAWCNSHQGIVMHAPDGRLVASCFYTLRDLALAGGSRSVYGTAPVIYFHHQVVASDVRRLGIGQRVGEATIALAYAVTDGPFPSCVACAYLDSPQSLSPHSRAGMFIIPQSETSVIDSSVVLRSLDTNAWAVKAREGSVRPHALEFFNQRELLRIAHWLVFAFAGPVRLHGVGVKLKMLDPSDGRSNFRRAMRSLGRREPEALSRLSMLRCSAA